MKKLTIGFVLIANLGFPQVNYEQIATNYFFDSIYFQNFKSKTLQFSGFTNKESTYFFSYVTSCFDNDQNLQFTIKLNEAAFEIPNKEIKHIESSQVNLRFKKKYKVKLGIFNETELNEKHYVLIVIAEKDRQSYFYFELLEDGTISNWCRTGVIY